MQTRRFTTTLLSLVALSSSALAQNATPAWYSGFENGWPGANEEWLPYDPESFNPNGNVNPGYNEAWTIEKGGSVPYAGEGVYKGWAVAPQQDSHRAYPVVHLDIPSPLVNSFMVYLDVDYNSMSETEWVHFATWSNNEQWNVHTLAVRDRKLEMAHLDWDYIGSGSQQDFPLKRWVRITAYINYQGKEGYIRLWQDGKPTFEGTYDTVAGTRLVRAHWGWYSSGSITKGVQYNDEIQIWKLDAPLTDLETEPASPYPQLGSNPGAGAGGASGSSTGGATSSAGRTGRAGAGSSGGRNSGATGGAEPTASGGRSTSSRGGAPSFAGRNTSSAGTTSSPPSDDATGTTGQPPTSSVPFGGAANAGTGGFPAGVSVGSTDKGTASGVPELERETVPTCALSGNASRSSSAWALMFLGALIPLRFRRQRRA